ncbi:MotE family protein [Peribacillus sp. NPDC096379]|uniref:MotE family protein n=1 Tax=Peribacillus sp. NPDC096379 TaxID=3364393 RepID=UPI0038054A39
MKKIDETEHVESNKFQVILFSVLIFLLFTLLVLVIYLSFTGTNVFKKSKEFSEKIPFVSQLLDKNDEKDPNTSTENFQEKVVDLEAEIKDHQSEIKKLESLIDSRDKQLERNELEKQQLEMEIEELRSAQEINNRAFQDIVKTYETISPKKSAPIISKMGDEEAIKILSSIKTDKLAAILEQLTPDDAARFTKLLASKSSTN